MDVSEETRDWAELPRDALLAVFHSLQHADVLMRAGQVCRPWRRAAREEPELWRRIDLRRRAALSTSILYHLDVMARTAVTCSAGQCEAFWAEDFVDDTFIFFLSHRATGLRSLRLISCNISKQAALNEAITRFSMLEELELSLCSGATTASGHYNLADTCTAAAKACRNLKCLRLNKYRFHRRSGYDGDSEAMEIAKMRGLRCLQLFGNSLGNAGLAAILAGCAHLESLDIRHCFNVEVNDETRVMCARLQTLKLPDDSMDGYDLSFGNPEMNAGIPGLDFPHNAEMNFGFRGDILWDSW